MRRTIKDELKATALQQRKDSATQLQLPHNYSAKGVRPHTHARTLIHTHTYTYIHTYTHIHIHTDTHTYTHTHTPTHI